MIPRLAKAIAEDSATNMRTMSGIELGELRVGGAGSRGTQRTTQGDGLFHPHQPRSMPTSALTNRAPRAVGIITFHPMFINWS